MHNACTHIHMYTHTHMFTSSIHNYMYFNTHMYTSICTHAHTRTLHLHMNIRTHTPTCTRHFTHVHVTHTHILTYSRTLIYWGVRCVSISTRTPMSFYTCSYHTYSHTYRPLNIGVCGVSLSLLTRPHVYVILHMLTSHRLCHLKLLRRLGVFFQVVSFFFPRVKNKCHT